MFRWEKDLDGSGFGKVLRLRVRLVDWIQLRLGFWLVDGLRFDNGLRLRLGFRFVDRLRFRRRFRMESGSRLRLGLGLARLNKR